MGQRPELLDMRTLLALSLLAMTAWSQEAKVPDSVKKAEAKLKENPDDPDANATVGKYLGLETGQWEKAIPLLAKGSDSTLKRLAEHESQPHEQGIQMVGLADEWLSAGKKFPLRDRKKFEERAIIWYGKAWSSVGEKDKARLRDLFRKVASPPPGWEKPGKTAGSPAGWVLEDNWKAYLESGFTHSGRHSVKILPPDPGKPPWTGAHSNPIPVQAGRKLVLSAWVFTDRTEAAGKIDLRVYDASGKFLPNAGSAVIPEDAPFWQKVDAEIEIPPGAARIDLNLVMVARQGGTWVDDVSLKCDGKELLPNVGFEGR